MAILCKFSIIFGGLVLCIVAATSPVAAATIHIDASATGEIEDGTPSNPFNTIQEGLNIAAEGDQVLVAPGIYYGALELAHNVQLVSVEGPEVTIIDGMSASQVLTSPYHLNPNSYIEGFTIRGGTIFISAMNRVEFWYSSTMTIDNSIIEGMADTFDIGISISPSAQVNVTRTLFRNLGRGIDAIWCPAPQMTNVTVDGSSSAFFIYQIGLNLKNTTVSNADYVVELWGHRGSGNVFGSNNNFFAYGDFSRPNWDGRYPHINLTNSLEADPLFVAPMEVDYHLLVGSPLIDAGIDVGLPYVGAAPDIGAYEFDQLSIPELVEQLAESYNEVPVSGYKNVGEQRRNALSNKFRALLQMLDVIDENTSDEEALSILTSARNKLIKDIWGKADGFYGGKPENDWITTEEEQARLYEKVMEVLASIDEEIAALSDI